MLADLRPATPTSHLPNHVGEEVNKERKMYNVDLHSDAKTAVDGTSYEDEPTVYPTAKALALVLTALFIAVFLVALVSSLKRKQKHR
jgi:hypothetical protein